ncbi:NYN domain-containing protein [Actinokineospora diospyrosa]|uniref:NYN domain-containing protein n=1 Tax=Actinokineospora diospyrosa TaxID=103728 RepID=A0ABT1I9L3_9PSEU|nr:NYN domain-containing protein [Actinokineospora diospyrosa]MCP2269315.1 NYN domain-containing protein [Actinokineospora diospyrosa]
MTPRCAVYVDAGYLLAAAATRATGTSLRGGISADHERLVAALIAHAEERSGLPLLRVHWYDAAENGVPDATQRKIGLLSRVKLRLGRIGFDGEQKGVDLRIGLDLVAHARNAAIDSAYLVSGDDDLTEAVEEAQAHGLQVIILAVPGRTGAPHGVSHHLHAAADDLELLAADDLDSAITRRHAPTPAVGATAQAPVPSPALLANRPRPTPTRTEPAPPTGLVYSSTTALAFPADLTETIDSVARHVLTSWSSGRSKEELAELETARPSIPREVDRALLRDLSDASGLQDLSDPIRYQLRARFWAEVDQFNQP